MAMDALSELKQPDLSAGKRYALFVAALAVALLGLTTVDVVGQRPAAERAAVEPDSAERIVASAIFAGVAPDPHH